MKKITPAQKKIIIIALIVVLGFFLFWMLVYLPSKKSVAAIKRELVSVEAQLEEIQAMIGKDQSINVSMRLLMERHHQLDAIFPQKEEETLRMISRFTRDLNIELLSIKPKHKVVWLDENNREIEMEGRRMQSLSVTIGLRCFYKDLVKYLQALREDMPIVITIERLKINKDRSGSAKLNVVLDINLYLLS